MSTINSKLYSIAALILAASATPSLAEEAYNKSTQNSITIPYRKPPPGRRPPPNHPLVCQNECMSPTGLYFVCRYSGSRQVVSRKLVDINRCMN